MKKVATALLILATFNYLYSANLKDMSNIEIWKDIPSYEGYYQASNLGRIKRVDRPNWKGRIMKLRKADNGYLRIMLSVNNIVKSHPVHRLIALTFIQNPLNKKFINHKNGIRDDNRVENLEWCT